MCHSKDRNQTLLSSLMKIQRFIRKAVARLHWKKNRRLYRIRADKGPTLCTIYIKGDFTNPPWEVKVPLAYSLKFKEYFVELWLRPSTEFVLFTHSIAFTDLTFPIRIGERGPVNYIEHVDALPTELFFQESPPQCSSHCLSLKSVGISQGKSLFLNEDAFFLSDNAIGVSDGVGSLREELGIPSADFSQGLMENCEAYSVRKAKEGKSACCRKMVKSAYDSVTEGGSATYTVASLQNKNLQVLNLGDSGLHLLRYQYEKWEIVFQTSLQQHFFNCPYQVSKKFSLKQLRNARVSKYNSKLMLKFSKELDRCLEDAEEASINVRANDLIVMATDGLWDNVYISEIVALANLQGESVDIQGLSEGLMAVAQLRTRGEMATPFSDSFSRNTGSHCVGGKPDDITIIVSSVIEST